MTRWAAVAAMVLTVAIVGGFLIASALRGKHAAPPPPAAASPAPLAAAILPAGNVIDADLRNVGGGWALLENCTGGKCIYSVTTTDRSGSWSRPVPVGPSYAETDGDAPRQVHIVSPDGMNGFVFGHLEAFVTHDGGRTWKDAGLGAWEVVDIVGRGTAWAITRPCGKGIVCPYQAQLSRDGGATWLKAAPLPDAFEPSGAAAFGKGGLLVSGFGTGDMVLTKDGGLTWMRIGGRCRSTTGQNFVATVDGVELWQACSASLNPDLTAAFISEDGGATWSERTVPKGAAAPAGLAAMAPGSALMASGSTPVELTVDGGRSWAPVTPVYSLFSLAWWSGQAWASNANEIWASADGGRSWSRIGARG